MLTLPKKNIDFFKATASVVKLPVQATPEDKKFCLFINTYYNNFLRGFYAKNPNLHTASFKEQKKRLQDQCFGDSDFYSKGLQKEGFDAGDLIVNCEQLQQAWARELGVSGDSLSILLQQLKNTRPDVVYFQDLSMGNSQFLAAIRPYVGLIVGQIASPLPPQTDLSGFDIIVSSFPHFVDRFRLAGITAYYQPLAFEPRVLQSRAKFAYDKRPIDCSFVGGISHHHGNGYKLLEALAAIVPIDFWGYGAETLPPESVIRKSHHGEVWGREMFYVLGASKITINRHIDVAENYANNMRLFEATGCGALLITDYKDNLNELFEIGVEIVAFRSPEECAAMVNYYLTHPDEAEAIARAGQARTLRDHTYARRMEQTAEILTRHLRYQGEKTRLPVGNTSGVSYGRTLITADDVTPAMTTAWQNQHIPARQRVLVQDELADMYRGNIVAPFKALVDILKPVVDNNNVSILEIGCASGYCYEIMEYLLNKRIAYTGVDYSEPMIDMAKDYYPNATFYTADGASLFFADRKYHIVISSCVLLHVPNWRQHVYETVRVADKYVVASRTSVCKSSPTRYMKKFAYGIETVELQFNEFELIREFKLNGLELIDVNQYNANPADDEYQATYLFMRP